MPNSVKPAEDQQFEDEAVSAVIDRIDGDVAVVLVGADDREITCSTNPLPSGVRAGGAVRLQLDGNRILHIDVDPDEDAARAARIGAKLERLRENRDGKP